MTYPRTDLESERLLFRRQFILGHSGYQPNSFWSSVELDSGLILSHHRDLPIFSRKGINLSVHLLGIAIDPVNDLHQEEDVLALLLEDTTDTEEIIEKTRTMGGRWIMVIEGQKDQRILSDSCGFRTVYYTGSGYDFWVGSTPEILRQKVNLQRRADQDVQDFIRSRKFHMKETAWLGETTLYRDCYQLLPNHFLKVDDRTQIRFFPKGTLSGQLDYQKVVGQCAHILKNSILLYGRKSRLIQPLTAGWDTRLLLAASKEHLDQTLFFIDTHHRLSADHHDLLVSSALARKLGLQFEIREPDLQEFPEDFKSILSHNSTSFSFPENRWIIYDQLSYGDDKLKINGNIGEMGRSHYNRMGQFHHPNEIVTMELINIFGYDKVPYVIQESIEKWRQDFLNSVPSGYSILDFLYWEQKMGTWASLFRSHQDVVIDEVSPFNCRYLLELFLQIPVEKKMKPDYEFFKDMTQALWPAVLEEPINPRRTRPWYKKMEKNLRVWWKGLFD